MKQSVNLIHHLFQNIAFNKQPLFQRNVVDSNMGYVRLFFKLYQPFNVTVLVA